MWRPVRDRDLWHIDLHSMDLPIFSQCFHSVQLGRSNLLFAGNLLSGQRASNVMSLIQSAKLNGHYPYAYLKDVLAHLPTQRVRQIDELLPHNWQPSVKG